MEYMILQRKNAALPNRIDNHGSCPILLLIVMVLCDDHGHTALDIYCNVKTTTCRRIQLVYCLFYSTQLSRQLIGNLVTF